MEQNELSALSIVGLFQTTKDQRQSFASQVIEAVNQGEVNPLKLHLQIKCMEDIIKSIKDNEDYKKAVLSEAQLNGKTFSLLNAKIEIKEVGVKYDYSVTRDPVMSVLSGEDEILKAKIKERESFLKAVPKDGLIITDENTGENLKIYPPAKSSTTSTVVTLK